MISRRERDAIRLAHRTIKDNGVDLCAHCLRDPLPCHAIRLLDELDRVAPVPKTIREEVQEANALIGPYVEKIRERCSVCGEQWGDHDAENIAPNPLDPSDYTYTTRHALAQLKFASELMAMALTEEGEA